jgi:hypothetical protein
LGDGSDDLVSLVALRSVSLPSWPPASPTGIGVELKNLGSTHNPAAVRLADAPGLACTQVAMCVVRTIARIEVRSKANADLQALRDPLWETPEATTAAIAVGQLADGPSDTLPSSESRPAPSWPPASPTGIGVELENLGSTHNPAAVWLAGAPGLACTQVAMCVVRTIARIEARSKANADLQAYAIPCGRRRRPRRQR